MVKAIELQRRGISVIGGGIMGLLAALDLKAASRRMGIEVRVSLFEQGRLGGGSATASSPRCQLWLHRQGVLYAQTQPHVALALQRSTARLAQLAPGAIGDVLALAIEPPGSNSAAQCFESLGIQHSNIPPEIVSRMLPGVRFREGSRVFRTLDGTLDLTVAVEQLRARARRLGVRMRQQRVEALHVRGDRVVGLRLAGNEQLAVAGDDQVVLACAAGIRPLLGQTGIRVPGLRHFVCTLAAAETGVEALLAYLVGGVNLVPHALPDGRLLNVFGNAKRVELPPETDGQPVAIEPGSADALCREVEECFGIRLPQQRLAWPGVKTEIVAEGGARSQSHHAMLVPGLNNAWLAIPGKLSQAAETARVLSQRIQRHWIDEQIARPIWEEIIAEEHAASQRRRTA